MSVIHLTQIRAQIEKLFRGKIDLSDVDSPNCDPKNLDNFFLTRGLAAYAIHYLAQASAEDSSAAVTDGGDDNGVDAVHYDPVEKRLYIAQSKWIRGAPFLASFARSGPPLQRTRSPTLFPTSSN